MAGERRNNQDFVDKGSKEELTMLENFLSIYDEEPDDPMAVRLRDRIKAINKKSLEEMAATAQDRSLSFAMGLLGINPSI